MRSILLMTVVASLALAGCSSRAASTRAPAQPSASGIQTQAYDRAPATQAPSGSSKPLSETNAPDAVAARQALARASGKSVPQNSARESALVATRGEPTAPHAQVASFQKGYQAKVRAGAAAGRGAARGLRRRRQRPQGCSRSLWAIQPSSEPVCTYHQ